MLNRSLKSGLAGIVPSEELRFGYHFPSCGKPAFGTGGRPELTVEGAIIRFPPRHVLFENSCFHAFVLFYRLYYHAGADGQSAFSLHALRAVRTSLAADAVYLFGDTHVRGVSPTRAPGQPGYGGELQFGDPLSSVLLLGVDGSRWKLLFGFDL